MMNAANKIVGTIPAGDWGRMVERAATAEAVLAEVRRYAELTLDSISIERRGMAQDVLDILDGGE